MSATSAYTEAWLTGLQSTQFYTRLYRAVPPGAKAGLVFIHGFIEHIARYEHVFPYGQQRGISVFAYDQRGFGRTAQGKEDPEKCKFVEYGRTSHKSQIEDAEWALKYAKEQFGDVPLFLMGHSMGGGVALSFATRTSAHPAPASISLVSGVIASSPLILQTTPAPKLARWIGGKVSALSPYSTVTAKVVANDLSKDEVVNTAYMKDPLVRQYGTLKGISDMLNVGEALLKNDYQHWPTDLPVLLIHGTDDKVTSFKASEDFFGKLITKDKTFVPFKGGYHELHNEPDGVKENFVKTCVDWVDERISKAPNASLPAQGQPESAKL